MNPEMFMYGGIALLGTGAIVWGYCIFTKPRYECIYCRKKLEKCICLENAEAEEHKASLTIGHETNPGMNNDWVKERYLRTEKPAEESWMERTRKKGLSK